MGVIQKAEGREQGIATPATKTCRRGPRQGTGIRKKSVNRPTKYENSDGLQVNEKETKNLFLEERGCAGIDISRNCQDRGR
jgi:hypothetical protein